MSTSDVSKWFSKDYFEMVIYFGGVDHACIDKSSTGLIFLFTDGTRQVFSYTQRSSFNCDRLAAVVVPFSLKSKSIKTVRAYSNNGRYIEHTLSSDEADFFKFIVDCLEDKANTIK
jgi:hypothetical protein